MNCARKASGDQQDHSFIPTVNILTRLQHATEQIRTIQSKITVENRSSDHAEHLDTIGKELEDILANLANILSDDSRQSEMNIVTQDGQISKWLKQTFSSKQHRSNSSTGRFESVKAIFQVSSFVHALQRQIRQNKNERIGVLCHLPVNIQQLNQWSFNIFEYSQPIFFTLFLIFDTHDLIARYQIDWEILKNFARALTDGYTKFHAVYHNDYHGADVLQTTYCLLTKCNLINTFTPLEITALLFAAVIHDYEHPGLNNNYLIKTQNDLALTYNDSSVLENHHSSSVFKLLRDKRLNIWSNMSGEEYRTFRSLVISLVLATDMANHASIIERMSTYLFLKETNCSSTDSKTFLQTILHAADISNAAKPWSIYIQSTEKIMEEFYQQGDLEKIHCPNEQPTFDRDSTDLIQLQIGFISHIVYPTFDILSKIMPIDSQEINAQRNLQMNLSIWREIGQSDQKNEIILEKKPLKLNFDYLQIHVNRMRHASR